MTARLTVLPSGSLRVEGRFTLVDPDGTAYDLAGRTRVHLCRCGQSATRPFCDDTHRRCGFSDPAEAWDRPPPRVPPPPAPGGADCRITVNHHGGYRVEGAFELRDVQGGTYGLGGRPSISLCRCGASGEKPFCDGTHNTVRFRHEARAQEAPGGGGEG